MNQKRRRRNNNAMEERNGAKMSKDPKKVTRNVFLASNHTAINKPEFVKLSVRSLALLELPVFDCKLQIRKFSWKQLRTTFAMEWNSSANRLFAKCSDLPQAALKTLASSSVRKRTENWILCLFFPSLHVFLTRFRIFAYARMEIDTNFELIIFSAFRVHTKKHSKLRH